MANFYRVYYCKIVSTHFNLSPSVVVKRSVLSNKITIEYIMRSINDAKPKSASFNNKKINSSYYSDKQALMSITNLSELKIAW